MAKDLRYKLRGGERRVRTVPPRLHGVFAMSSFRRASALAALLLGLGCGGGDPEGTVVEFWALGREGEYVRSLVPAFEARHPGVTVRVQQIPWSAAHEKLLTAFVGDALPDVIQLGNTWIPEFVQLGALEPLDA